MRLVYRELDLEIDLEENVNYVIYIERQDLFTRFVESLWRQQNGEEGAFLLSDGAKEYAIAKEIQVIVNPFDISCNHKRIITKLYQDIASIAMEEYVEELTLFQQQSIQLIDKLAQKVPYQLEYNLEFGIEELLKLFDMKISSDTGTLAERIIDYLRIVHQIMKQRIFIFINLKAYLTEEEMQMLYEFCSYEKIILILVENVCKNCNYDKEKIWIIDKDLCIIKSDELTAHGQCDSSVRTQFEV